PAQEGGGVPAQRVLVAGAAGDVAERAGLHALAGRLRVVVDVDEPLAHARRTVSSSPSTATLPPRACTTRTATAAPRSRRSSPSSTGADAGVTGEIASSGPWTLSSTSSKPPWRSAQR